MENANFMKKLWKSLTSGKYWGNRQQQKKYYGNRMRPFLITLYFQPLLLVTYSNQANHNYCTTDPVPYLKYEISRL